jgi:hypothetical protein
LQQKVHQQQLQNQRAAQSGKSYTIHTATVLVQSRPPEDNYLLTGSSVGVDTPFTQAMRKLLKLLADNPLFQANLTRSQLTQLVDEVVVTPILNFFLHPAVPPVALSASKFKPIRDFFEAELSKGKRLLLN